MQKKNLNKILLFALSIILFFTVAYVILSGDEGAIGSNDQIIQIEQQEDVEQWIKEHQKDEQSKYVSYTFRNNELLQSHFEKHGIDMGFADAAAYEKAASDVINNPLAEHKTEKEDGDLVYYIEETNEFVILSKPQSQGDKGFIRTYFLPDDGRDYYDRQ